MEAMQLDEEGCALMPLVTGAGGQPQPALPATEATAQRVQLAILELGRIINVCGKRNHMGVYLERGGAPRDPPLERCIIAELPALLRRSIAARAEDSLQAHPVRACACLLQLLLHRSPAPGGRVPSEVVPLPQPLPPAHRVHALPVSPLRLIDEVFERLDGAGAAAPTHLHVKVCE